MPDVSKTDDASRLGLGAQISVLFAIGGLLVSVLLGGTTLVSLPWFPMAVAQSVIPIGAVLFIAAQLLSLPQALAGPGPPGDGAQPTGDAPGDPT